MSNPMIIAPEDIIIDFTSEKGDIEANATKKPVSTYKYCFLGITLSKTRVENLKNAMVADTQFYVEIRFKDVLDKKETNTPKFVHQVFDYAVLDETSNVLVLKMDGYYELPAGYALSRIDVKGAKLFYIANPETPTVE